MSKPGVALCVTEDASHTATVVHEPETDGRDTGLVTEQGQRILRPRNPIGFVWSHVIPSSIKPSHEVIRE